MKKTVGVTYVAQKFMVGNLSSQNEESVCEMRAAIGHVTCSSNALVSHSLYRARSSGWMNVISSLGAFAARMFYVTTDHSKLDVYELVAQLVM